MKRKLTPFGEKVEIRLIELGMTQKELAEKIDCGAVYLNIILHGRRSGEKYIESIINELGLDEHKAPLEPIKTESRPIIPSDIEKGFLGLIKECLGINADDYIAILQFVSKAIERRKEKGIKTTYTDLIKLIANADKAIKLVNRNTVA